MKKTAAFLSGLSVLFVSAAAIAQNQADPATVSGTFGKDRQIEQRDSENVEKPRRQGAAGFLSRQDQSETLSSAYAGAPVLARHDGSEERVGEVSALVLDENGTVRGIVADIGGVFGLGEKTVGIPWSDVTVSHDGGRLRVVTSLSVSELESAPEYVSMAQNGTGQGIEAFQ